MADYNISGIAQGVASGLAQDALSLARNRVNNLLNQSTFNRSTGNFTSNLPNFGSGGSSGLGGFSQVQSLFSASSGISNQTYSTPNSTNVPTLIEYIESQLTDNPVLKYYMGQFYRNSAQKDNSGYTPDINGYNFIFMIPPDLSGYRESNIQTFKQSRDGFARGAIAPQINDSAYQFAIGSGQTNNFEKVSRFLTFSAIDFTPPSTTTSVSNFSTRSGHAPYATELQHSDSLSVNCIDNATLDVYTYHLIWSEYIRDVTDGIVLPSREYWDLHPDNYTHNMTIDYMGAAYIVRYMPDMQKIVYCAKCIGIFPQNIPSKEVLGTRGQHEITNLGITYSVCGYREATYSSGRNMWVFEELARVLSGFGDTRTSGNIITPSTANANFAPVNSESKPWKNPNDEPEPAAMRAVPDSIQDGKYQADASERVRSATLEANSAAIQRVGDIQDKFLD